MCGWCQNKSTGMAQRSSELCSVTCGAANQRIMEHTIAEKVEDQRILPALSFCLFHRLTISCTKIDCSSSVPRGENIFTRVTIVIVGVDTKNFWSKIHGQKPGNSNRNARSVIEDNKTLPPAAISLACFSSSSYSIVSRSCFNASTIQKRRLSITIWIFS